VYFNVNFNVFFKLIKLHLLVSELNIYQNALCNDKKKEELFRHCNYVTASPKYNIKKPAAKTSNETRRI